MFFHKITIIIIIKVTNFWDPSIFPDRPEGEIEQGKNMVDAAKDVGVKFFVWRYDTLTVFVCVCAILNLPAQCRMRPNSRRVNIPIFSTSIVSVMFQREILELTPLYSPRKSGGG
jgi:hypothetical protein